MSNKRYEDFTQGETTVKISLTSKPGQWHVTLWHGKANLNIRTVKGRDLTRAAVVAVSKYLLENNFDSGVIHNLALIKQRLT